MHRAAESGQPGALALLLAAGANWAAPDSGGHAPIHLAAGQGHIECVRVLVRNGADIHARDNVRRTGVISSLIRFVTNLIKSLWGDWPCSLCRVSIWQFILSFLHERIFDLLNRMGSRSFIMRLLVNPPPRS